MNKSENLNSIRTNSRQQKMAILFLSGFKNRPSELNFLLLCFSGYWPLPTRRKWLQILYAIYSFLCFFSIISMFFIQILDVYLLRNDKINLVKNLCASSITFACVAKYVLLFFKVENIEKLHNELNDFADSVTDPEDVEIIEKGENDILWMTKCFYGPAIPCVIVWMLYPGLESSHERRVPFPYRLPRDFKDTPYYEIVYTYQSMSMVGFLINILSTDLVFCSFVIRINAQLELIGKNMRAALKRHENNYSDERNDDNTIVMKHDAIKETISKHQLVFEEINQLQRIYSHPFLLHFFGVIIQVGAIVMEVVVIRGVKLQIVQRMIYGACGLFDTFFLCYFGTRLEEECMKVGRVMYETDWHKMSPKIRKYLIMIMTRSKRPSLLKMSSFFPLNLSTYLEFLKLSCNIAPPCRVTKSGNKNSNKMEDPNLFQFFCNGQLLQSSAEWIVSLYSHEVFGSNSFNSLPPFLGFSMNSFLHVVHVENKIIEFQQKIMDFFMINCASTAMKRFNVRN